MGCFIWHLQGCGMTKFNKMWMSAAEKNKNIKFYVLNCDLKLEFVVEFPLSEELPYVLAIKVA